MKKLGLIIIAILSFTFSNAQTTVITDDSTYTPTSTNAILEVHSANGNKGILVPRLTTAQRTAISTSAANDKSLLVFDTDTNTFWYFDGTQWVEIIPGGTDDQLLTLSNDTLYIENGNWIYLGGYMDNTDSQTLSLSGNSLSISNGNSVDLSSLGNDWKLTGNSGTTVGTNFLGTTDNVSLSFKTNNAERLRITNSGNVGIGTTTPSSGLHIVKSSSTEPTLTIEHNSNNGTDKAFRILSQGNENVILHPNGSGFFMNNIGIGTTAPSEKLEIYGDAQNIKISNTTETDAGIILNDAQATSSQYAQITYGSGDNDLNFLNASATPRMVIESSGNVGIGTTSPSEKLDVVGNIKASGIAYWGSDGIRTETRNDAGASGAGIRSGFYQTSSPSPAADWPTGASGWWHLLDIRHTNTSNNYAMQFAGSFNDQKLYFRKTNGSATQAWNEVTTAATETYTAVSLGSNIAITTSGFADIPGMSLTFTAKKSTVLVTVTASGHGYTNSMAYVGLRVWNVTSGTSIGGCSNKIQAYDDTEGTVTVWNASFSKLVTGLTPGNTYTFKIQGMRDGITGTYDAIIYPVTYPDQENLTLSVFY